jgi:hypothetical protein
MPASLTIPQQVRGNLAMQKRHPPTAVRCNCKKAGSLRHLSTLASRPRPSLREIPPYSL